jgi:hypothetical protein
LVEMRAFLAANSSQIVDACVTQRVKKGKTMVFAHSGYSTLADFVMLCYT